MFTIQETLTYGNEGFKEIRKFLERNYHQDYTLSIYDTLGQDAVEVICDYDSMVDVIAYVSNAEHDFPEWIGVNDLSESYVVGMSFTRGNIKTSSVYEWREKSLLSKVKGQYSILSFIYQSKAARKGCFLSLRGFKINKVFISADNIDKASYIDFGLLCRIITVIMVIQGLFNLVPLILQGNRQNMENSLIGGKK